MSTYDNLLQHATTVLLYVETKVLLYVVECCYMLKVLPSAIKTLNIMKLYINFNNNIYIIIYIL